MFLVLVLVAAHEERMKLLEVRVSIRPFNRLTGLSQEAGPNKTTFQGICGGLQCNSQNDQLWTLDSLTVAIPLAHCCYYAYS